MNIVASAAKLGENADDYSITVFPNPIKEDVLNVSIKEDNAPYRIINLVGQEIANGKIENGRISVSKITAGNYLLEITVNDNRIVKRFIKE